MAKYTHTYGGVGAPVGLTVFKTAGGSLGAVPGGFDSHTPLPLHEAKCCNFQRNCEMKWNSNVIPKKWKKRCFIFLSTGSHEQSAATSKSTQEGLKTWSL